MKSREFQITGNIKSGNHQTNKMEVNVRMSSLEKQENFSKPKSAAEKSSSEEQDNFVHIFIFSVEELILRIEVP